MCKYFKTDLASLTFEAALGLVSRNPVPHLALFGMTGEGELRKEGF